MDSSAPVEQPRGQPSGDLHIPPLRTIQTVTPTPASPSIAVQPIATEPTSAAGQSIQATTATVDLLPTQTIPTSSEIPPISATTEDIPSVPPDKHNRKLLLRSVIACAVIIAITIFGMGGYSIGYSRGQTAQGQVDSRANALKIELKAPADATIISQCAKGRGTQYVLPKDIPQGPVYNVYKGKVIGLEFMIGKNDLLNAKSFLSLPLYGHSYDHIDVGLLSQGHAGYPEPHYHVDVYNVTPAESAAITCK